MNRLCVVLLLVGACSGPQTPRPADPYTACYNKALALFDPARCEESLAAVKRMASTDPDCVQAALRYGKVLDAICQ